MNAAAAQPTQNVTTRASGQSRRPIARLLETGVYSTTAQDAQFQGLLDETVCRRGIAKEDTEAPTSWLSSQLRIVPVSVAKSVCSSASTLTLAAFTRSSKASNAWSFSICPRKSYA